MYRLELEFFENYSDPEIQSSPLLGKRTKEIKPFTLKPETSVGKAVTGVIHTCLKLTHARLPVIHLVIMLNTSAPKEGLV